MKNGTSGPKPRKNLDAYRPTYIYKEYYTELLKNFDEYRRKHNLKFPTIIHMIEFLEEQGWRDNVKELIITDPVDCVGRMQDIVRRVRRSKLG